VRRQTLVAVRSVERGDAAAWLRLRQALWPEGSAAEHGRDIEDFFSKRALEPHAVLIAEDQDCRKVGIAELSIRPWAEGCESSRVAYLEGWFVVPEARRQGVGRALVEAAEKWARAQGCGELASDTQPDNSAGIAAHRAIGFTDVGTIRCYRKEL